MMMTQRDARFFNLTEAPFTKEITDADLWLPPSKRPIVDALCEAVHPKSTSSRTSPLRARARQCVLLTGEPGVGKTCVLRAVRHQLNAPDIRLTYCHNVMLGRRDLYRQLCVALDLHPSATAAARSP